MAYDCLQINECLRINESIPVSEKRINEYEKFAYDSQIGSGFNCINANLVQYKVWFDFKI